MILMKLCEGNNYLSAIAKTGALALFLAAAGSGCELYFGPVPSGDHGKPDDTVPDDTALCTGEQNGDSRGDEPPNRPLEIGFNVRAERPPPAISGGTMAITPDQKTVVAGDPDRDMVYIVSLETNTLEATVAMNRGDEPGRIAIDDAGRAHIAMRTGGAVVSIDIATAEVIGRYRVCPAPRGITFDAKTGAVYVACHSGFLVTMDPATGEVTRKQKLDSDLRDVAVDDSYIYVSRLRTAEAIILDREGQRWETMTPPPLDTISFDFETGEEEQVQFEPAVAWRTRAAPGGGVIMLHQRARSGKVRPGKGGYAGDPCFGGVIQAALTPMQSGQQPLATMGMGFAVLPVDFTLINGGRDAVVVAAGNAIGVDMFVPPVMRVPVGQPHQDFECGFAEPLEVWSGQPIAVASTTDNTVVVQFREPAKLEVFTNGGSSRSFEIPLSTESRADTGHAMFHMNAGGGVACASCHPEGADDGRVWDFHCVGPRRSQNLQFGLLGTEPFHWEGDMTDFSTLMGEVFVGRMTGGTPTAEQAEAMALWMDTLRTPPRGAPEDPLAVARGRQLFESDAVGCSSCHSGPKFTSNLSYDVGTGGTFQAPTLIGLNNHAPYIHTGCAPTLMDRFTDTECGGGDKHGVVSHLTTDQLEDLIAYLLTL
jgi:mono/diheme cytochrome c family protein